MFTCCIGQFSLVTNVLNTLTVFNIFVNSVNVVTTYVLYVLVQMSVTSCLMLASTVTAVACLFSYFLTHFLGMALTPMKRFIVSGEHITLELFRVG